MRVKTPKQAEALKLRLVEVKERFPKLLIPEDINAVSDNFKAKCTICNYTWTTSLSRLIRTQGCPRCTRKSTSLAEQMIYTACEEALPEHLVLNGNRDTIGLELDVYIPDLQVAIEFGAWHWHKYRLDRDSEKENLCKEKGISLLTIYEGVKNNRIENINNYIAHKNAIKTYDNLVELAKEALTFVNYNIDASTLDWERVYEKAISRTNHDAVVALFRERMENEHPELAILGEYRRSTEPLLIKCKICGYTWETKPVHLLEGHSCPKCAIAKRAEETRKTTETFSKELTKLNPNLELVGEYKNSREKVKIRCKNCGTVWEARADYVLRDYKCPICESSSRRHSVKVASTEGHIKKKQILEEKLAKRDKNIEITGIVISDTDPVECRCKKCGTVFMRSPKELRRHPHCPKCNGHFRYTPDTFREKMAEVNPKIEVIDDFKKQAEKLECKCKTCGHHWEVTPNKLLQGRGCPACAAKLRSAAGVAARKAKKEKEIKWTETNTKLS